MNNELDNIKIGNWEDVPLTKTEVEYIERFKNQVSNGEHQKLLPNELKIIYTGTYEQIWKVIGEYSTRWAATWDPNKLTGPAAIKDKTDTRYKTMDQWLKQYQIPEHHEVIEMGNIAEQSDESIHSSQEYRAHKEWIREHSHKIPRLDTAKPFIDQKERIQKLVDELSTLPDEAVSEVMKQVSENWAKNEIDNIEMPRFEDELKEMMNENVTYHCRDNKVTIVDINKIK